MNSLAFFITVGQRTFTTFIPPPVPTDWTNEPWRIWSGRSLSSQIGRYWGRHRCYTLQSRILPLKFRKETRDVRILLWGWSDSYDTVVQSWRSWSISFSSLLESCLIDWGFVCLRWLVLLDPWNALHPRHLLWRRVLALHNSISLRSLTRGKQTRQRMAHL
jgi:hypothetical protein